MEKISGIVKSVMQGLGEKKNKFAKYDFEILLKKSLTKKALKHIKFNNFRKGTLSVNVDSSGWLYQLSLEKNDLLAKLRERLSGIKDIRFRLGQIR